MMKNTTLVGGLVVQGVAAIVGLAASFGLDLTTEQMAAILSLAGFLGVVVSLILWATTVDRAEVVERLIGDQVVAGEANDLVPSGAEVRTIETAPDAPDAL